MTSASASPSAVTIAVVVSLFAQLRPAMVAAEDSLFVFSVSPKLAVAGQKINISCGYVADWGTQGKGKKSLYKTSPLDNTLLLFIAHEISDDFKTLCGFQCPSVINRYKGDIPQPAFVNGTFVQFHEWHIDAVSSFDEASYTCEFAYNGKVARSASIQLEVAEVRSVAFQDVPSSVVDVYVLDAAKPYQFNCTVWVTAWNSIDSASYDWFVYFASDSKGDVQVTDLTRNFSMIVGTRAAHVPTDAGMQFGWYKLPLLISGWVTLDPSLIGLRLVCAARPNDATVSAALNIPQLSLTAAQRTAYEVRDSIYINKLGVDPEKNPVQFICGPPHGTFVEGERVELACNISQRGYDVLPKFSWIIRNRKDGTEKSCAETNVRPCQGFLKDIVSIRTPLSVDPVVSVSLVLVASDQSAQFTYTLLADYPSIRTFRTDNFTITAVKKAEPTFATVLNAAANGKLEPTEPEASRLSVSSGRTVYPLSAAVLLAAVFVSLFL